MYWRMAQKLVELIKNLDRKKELDLMIEALSFESDPNIRSKLVRACEDQFNALNGGSGFVVASSWGEKMDEAKASMLNATMSDYSPSNLNHDK